MTVSLLTGCILPDPHTTLRSGEVHGVVVDARTKIPIRGATVVQAERSGHPHAKERTRTTDAAGRFRLPASHNFHLIDYGAGEAREWPGEHWYDLVTISHPGYLSYKTEHWGEINVLLQPVDVLDLRGRVLDKASKKPIQGAKVRLAEYPSLTTTTDATGHFRLVATRDFMQAYHASESEDAHGQPFSDWVVVYCDFMRWGTFHWAQPERNYAPDKSIIVETDK